MIEYIIFPYILAKEEIYFLTERHLMEFFNKHEVYKFVLGVGSVEFSVVFTNVFLNILAFVYLKSQYFLHGCCKRCFLNIYKKIFTTHYESESLQNSREFIPPRITGKNITSLIHQSIKIA
jgi:hypothetical protein